MPRVLAFAPVLFLSLVLLPPQASAADDPESVIPEALEEWVPWVLRDQPKLACAWLDASRLCAWPGRLTLELDSRGGRFTQEVRVDRALDWALPGGPEQWPQDIRVNRKPGLLRRQGDIPRVHLEPGTHRVSGRFTWTRLPGQLALTGDTALLDLEVEGKTITHPVRSAEGSLLLDGSLSSATEVEEADTLSIEVHRRIDDGVPVSVTTRLRLRASGRAREIDLGNPLTEGFEAWRLTSTLPSRIDEEGHLKVQLRPGTWTVTVKSRSVGPVAALAVPEVEAPWPEQETWVFKANSEVRSVQVGGASGVDPQRTSLGADWRNLPAYLMERGGSLTFSELRRGEADPPPDALEVQREFWLSGGGGGLIVQDSVVGTFHEGGRLEFLSPGELGHVSMHPRERVITQLPGETAGGIELRRGAVSLEAESSYPRSGRLPAVGWNRDVVSLSGVLNLPPGWRLLAVSGVDKASGTWLENWSLLDLFFVLLITLALAKTIDLRWGLLGLVVLGLSWHEADAPRMGWLLLIGLSALLALELRPWLEKTLRGARWLVLAVLAVQVVVFCWGQVRTGLFPQLDYDGAGPYEAHGYLSGQVDWEGVEVEEEEFGVHQQQQLAWDAQGRPAEPPRKKIQRKRNTRVELNTSKSKRRRGQEYQVGSAPEPSARPAASVPTSSKAPTKRSAWIDPAAVVQTGPGIPKWSWSRYPLSWNGPVGADHEMRLFLLPPWAEGLASLFRVLGLVLLGIRLGDPRRSPGAPPGAGSAAPTKPPGESEPTVRDQPVPGASAGALVGLLSLLLVGAALLAPSPALAGDFPSTERLEELRGHLTKVPVCLSDGCVEVQSVEIEAGRRGLRIEAEVHVLEPSAWLLPGPDKAWLPDEVRVDGKAVSAMARSERFVAVRLEPGRHTVVATGPVRDEVTLQFNLVPRKLSWSGRDWSIEGYRPDGPPPRSVTLRRARGLDESGPGDSSGASPDLPPWLELRRELDIGIPWLVHNELVRVGPTSTAVHSRIPLLPGESVTTAGVVVEDGQALVTLEQGESSRTWDSTLEESDSLVLTAPTDRPWLEVWSLECSPIWSCTAEGLAPTRHMKSGIWRPRWQPWPGEVVTFNFSKPVAVAGATTTVDQATLVVEPGRRILAATLTFSVRSSQGGEQSIRIPPEGELQSFQIDGRDSPVEVLDGNVVYSLQPGAREVELSWRQDQSRGLITRTPEVVLSSGSANVMVTMSVPDNAWLLWAGGPSWGPVVTLWQYVLVLLLAAWLLGRFAPTELKTHQWFILGLGMTQVPLVAPIVVVVWLAALGVRGRQSELSWWRHDLWQLGLVGLSGLALLMIYWAVHSGLLVRPDMQVSGAGSGWSLLQWFAARSDGALPQPWVLWLPLWVWRVLMLLWALWLAVQLFRWALWGWKQLSVGGLWKMPEPKPKAKKAGKKSGSTAPAS